MDKLIQIKKPEKDDDFFKLWRSVSELIDAINDLSVTVVPSRAGFARISEGDIQLNFDPDYVNALLRALQDSSNPTSGNTDNPGSPPSGDDDSTVGGHCYGASAGGAASIVEASMGCSGCSGVFCPFHVQIYVGLRCPIPDGSYQLMGTNALGTQLWGTVGVSGGVITSCTDNWNNGLGGATPRTPPLLVDWTGNSSGVIGTSNYEWFWRDPSGNNTFFYGTWNLALTFNPPGSGCTCCPKTCGDCLGSGNAAIGTTLG